MSLGPHNNTRSGDDKNKTHVGFYVSNTSDIDKITIKNKLKGKKPRSQSKSTRTAKVNRKMNGDLKGM
jgi:hypothetical protein